MRTIHRHPTDWQGNPRTDQPKQEVHLFRFVAMALGAWGAGDSEAEALRNLRKAYGGKAREHIVYESPRQDLRGEGGSLCMYPPEEGFAPGHVPFEGVIERRYRRGVLLASGPWGQVQWPKARKTQK